MKCRHHADRESTHIVDIGKVPVCDECAELEREHGLLVVRHRGFLWGIPIVVEGDDGVLDASVLLGVRHD